MASRDKKSTENTSESQNQLIGLVKAIADKVTGNSGVSSNEKPENKRFGEFAQMVADKIAEKNQNKSGTISSGSGKSSNFQDEAIGILRRIDENIKKNDLPKFLESRLGAILQKTHQENTIWDENRADNRASKANTKQDELIDALKNLKSASSDSKTIRKKENYDDVNTEKNGGILSKIGGLLTGGIAGIGSLIAGSIFGGGALYHLTGGEKPNEVQSVARGASHFALRTGGKKLTQYASKLGAKKIGALRQLAKSPASKIIRESTKKMTKMLPKGGVAGRLMAPAKSILSRAGKASGIGKAIGKTGIKGVAKAGKLATKAKWLGKAAKLSKFGGKLLPGVGTALSVWETVGHIKNGNYGRAALSGISAVGSLIPGVGSVVSGVADAIGTGWDVFSAWKRRKAKKQEEQAEATKKENNRQKETVRQMTSRVEAKTEAKTESQAKSDKLGAMASKVDQEIKKIDKPQQNKPDVSVLGAAKTALKYGTMPGLAWTAWKNRDKIGKTITGTAKKVANSKVGKFTKTALKYGTLPGLAWTAWKNRDKIGKTITETSKGIANSKVGKFTKTALKYGTLPGITWTAWKNRDKIGKAANSLKDKTLSTAKRAANSETANFTKKVLKYGTLPSLALTAWKNRDKIGNLTKTTISGINGITKRIGNTKIGRMAKKLTSSKTGKLAKTALKYGTMPGLAWTAWKNRDKIGKIASGIKDKAFVSTEIKPTEKHTNPTVTAIKEKPQISQQPKQSESQTEKLSDIVTAQFTKTRDADIAQTKDITETFKAELEKVCAMLAQINATLPSLQPAPPPPVQQVMEGNKIPEFRKHNLEAIA